MFSLVGRRRKRALGLVWLNCNPRSRRAAAAMRYGADAAPAAEARLSERVLPLIVPSSTSFASCAAAISLHVSCLSSALRWRWAIRESIRLDSVKFTNSITFANTINCARLTLVVTYCTRFWSRSANSDLAIMNMGKTMLI